MPLARYVGIEGGEVVIPGEHFGVGAVWAAAVALGAAGDGGLILVAFVADPPDFFVAGGGDLLWGEAAVFGWVPFFGDGRILAGEVVDARNDLFAGADWAAAAVDSGGDGCAPFVAFVADPPDFSMRAGQDVMRGEAAILCGVPLAGELGISGGEVCFAVDGAPVCAEGAACAAAAAGVDGGLPVVAVGACPPYAVLAAAGDGLWCEGQVACAVPLGEEFFAVFAVAEVGQGFAHGDHLL